MGLDMYLYSVPRIEGMTLNEIISADAELMYLEDKDRKLYQKIKGYISHFEQFGHSWYSLITEVAYWRKANQIHGWFVRNVQDGKDDGGSYEVKKSDLDVLCRKCASIIDGIADPRETLPTQPGFFFGSLEYDDFYYNEISETYDTLLNLLQNFSFEENYLVYQSSW